MIRFTVLGIPATQGSKTPFRNKHTGRIHLVEGKGAGAERFKSFREAVRSEAQDVAERYLPDGPIEGPVSMRLVFGLPKPASAPKRRRTWPIGKRSGDLDKLVRLVFDAVTGVLVVDDGQVVHLDAGKDYGTPGVTVEVERVAEAAEAVS